MIKIEEKHRYLLKPKDGSLNGEIFEAVIEEISPSGKWVKIKSRGWIETKDYNIIEELRTPVSALKD
jgi:hypothetical protein